MGNDNILSMDAFIDENELFSPSALEEETTNNKSSLEELGLSEESKEDNTSTEEEVDPNNIFGASPEGVSRETDNNNSSTHQEEDPLLKEEETISTSPDDNTQFYSTILSSLRNDGILPDLDEEFVKNVQTPEDFAEAIEKQVNARLDATQQRIKAALDANISPDQIQQYETIINNLNNITDEDIEEDSENGEYLRKQLIYKDYINRGFTPERAQKEVAKSLAANTTVDDAKLALESNKEFYNNSYQNLITEQENYLKQVKEQRKKDLEAFNKKILETEAPMEGITVDKFTREKILENATKLIYKDKEGNLMTPIQKYISENPIDAQYYLNLFYTLTNGFKNIDKIVKPKVAKSNKENIRSLEAKLKNSHPFKDSGSDLFIDKESNIIRLDI